MTQHVILRERRDWVQMFGLVVGALLGNTPRNRVSPSPEMIYESVAKLEERLQTATVLVFSTHDGGFTRGSLAQGTPIGVLTQDLTNQMWHDVVRQAYACPWLSYETVDHASDLMYRYCMRGRGWDKALFKPNGLCRTLAEIHWTDSIIFGNRFAAWGWSDTPAVARALVVEEIVRRARAKGVLADAERLTKLPKPLREEASLHEWIDEFLQQSETDDWCSNSQGCAPTIEPKYPPFPKAPGGFELMKWKSNEFVAYGLKWRDIVSFAGHPLQAWSRVVSRCLQMLVNHLIDRGTGLGFAKMQGVRDEIHAAVRMGRKPQSLSLKEEDMTDMFWEIPSTEVKSALSWATNPCLSQCPRKVNHLID